MSLVQAIKHGKEHRKPHRGPKAMDGWCKNMDFAGYAGAIAYTKGWSN